MSNFKPCAAIMPLAIEACELAVFSGKLPCMEAEIDCELQSNSR
jgi:hypothetical protein